MRKINSKYNNKNYQEKVNRHNYIELNYKNYIPKNCAVGAILYENSFITEDGKFRIQINKRPKSTESDVRLNLLSIYDNKFNKYRENSYSKYKDGIILSGIDIIQNIIDENKDEMLRFINTMQLANTNSKNNCIMITKRESYKSYFNILFTFTLADRNEYLTFNSEFYQYNYALFPYNYIKMNIKIYPATKPFDVDNYKQYRYRINFTYNETIYFAEYEFYYKFIPMMVEAHNIN